MSLLYIIEGGGWLMLPILACSVIALTIVLERMWSLRRRRILPPKLLLALRAWAHQGRVGNASVQDVAGSSPLGRLVVTALRNRHESRERLRTAIEERGRQITHELERFLNTLGTIAAITPLLGLLGTVFGMIEVFTVISTQGSGDAEILAGGISKALLTTAAGLTVAIPSLLFYRYFQGKVDALVLQMEQEAVHLLDILKSGSDREEQV